MLLQQIDLHNFMCYYGHNKFTFSEGLNLIIGDNGYGKSKLFDALYWVMNDKIFDSEQKEFKPTSHFKKELIADRALSEAEDEDVIEAYVSISFQDEERGDIFIITRSYSVTRDEDDFKQADESEEIIKKKDLGYLQANPIDNPVEVDRIKRKILPDNIKPYMWFQGEQVESIIDFNKSESLTQAINVLSNISSFDEVSDIADELHESTRKEYNRKLKALSKDRNRSEELEKKHQKLKEDIEDLKKQQEEKEENLEKAEQRAEDLINKIDEAKQLKELDKEKSQTEKELYRVRTQEKEEQINLQKKLFSSK